MGDSISGPRYRVAIDCDPGRDDAIALLAALGSPELQVDLITTVAGNVPLDMATKNAALVLQLAGANGVLLYPGADRPMRRSPAPSDKVRGELSMGGPQEINPALLGELSADEALRRWLLEPGSTPRAIIAIGPLTNIGRLLRSNPSALGPVDAIYVMGGTVSRQATRISPNAEFNFFADPDAAQLVLRCGRPVYLIDYDATTACQIPATEAETLTTAIGYPVGDHVGAWLKHLYEHSNRPYGRTGIAVHDLYAVACAAGIEPARWERYRLDVETSSENRGALKIVENPDLPITNVARDLDLDAIRRFLADSCKRLSG